MTALTASHSLLIQDLRGLVEPGRVRELHLCFVDCVVDAFDKTEGNLELSDTSQEKASV